MGGRTLPTECGHGKYLDWGDFGDPVSEVCAICMGAPHPLISAFHQLQTAINNAIDEDPPLSGYGPDSDPGSSPLEDALVEVRCAILKTLFPDYEE